MLSDFYCFYLMRIFLKNAEWKKKRIKNFDAKIFEKSHRNFFAIENSLIYLQQICYKYESVEKKIQEKFDWF